MKDAVGNEGKTIDVARTSLDGMVAAGGNADGFKTHTFSAEFFLLCNVRYA